MSSTIDKYFPELIPVSKHLYKEVLALLEFNNAKTRNTKIRLILLSDFIRYLRSSSI